MRSAALVAGGVAACVAMAVTGRVAHATPSGPVVVNVNVDLTTYSTAVGGNATSYYDVTFDGQNFYFHKGLTSPNSQTAYVLINNGNSTGGSYTSRSDSGPTYYYMQLFPVGQIFGPSDGFTYRSQTTSDQKMALGSNAEVAVGLKTTDGVYGYAIFDDETNNANPATDGVYLLSYGYQTVANTAIQAEIPEPTSWAVLAAGLAGLFGLTHVRRRRDERSAA